MVARLLVLGPVAHCVVCVVAPLIIQRGSTVVFVVPASSLGPSTRLPEHSERVGTRDLEVAGLAEGSAFVESVAYLLFHPCPVVSFGSGCKLQGRRRVSCNVDG